MASRKKVRQQEKKRSVPPWLLLLLPPAILVLLGSIAYWNSTDVPFVYDDADTIQGDPNVRFGTFFTNLELYRDPRSLLYLTFTFNNWLNGQNVFGYHIFNIVLHVLNGLLIFALAVKTFGKTLTEENSTLTLHLRLRPSGLALRASPRGRGIYALLAAAFFLVHPIQTESVTYVSSRSELLAAFFYLLSCLLFASIRESKIGFLASIGVVVLMVLAYGSKETSVTLPAAILLYDYLFLAKAKLVPVLQRWRFYLTFLIVAAAGGYYLVLFKLSQLESYAGILPRRYYFLTELRVVASYIQLIIFPRGLNLDHEFEASTSMLDPAVLLSSLFFLGLVCAGWIWRRTNPVFSFSIFWFFITLSPTSSIVPIPDVMVEHRLYLPLVGVCLSFPLFIERLVRAATGEIRKKPLLAGAGSILAILTIGTILRNEIWRDEVRLFSDAVAKSPHKERPYNSLINAHMKRGEEEEAISVAQRGLQNISAPASRISFLDTIGNLYLRLGRPAEALPYFRNSSEEAVGFKASHDYLAVSFNNVGVTYLAESKTFDRDTGRRLEALRNAREWFQKSMEMNPNYLQVIDSYVSVTRALGEAAVLEQTLRSKLQADSGNLQNQYALASLLSLEERYPESVEHFRAAEGATGANVVLFFNHAFALSKLGEVDNAINKYLQALREDPTFSEARYNLALLYIQKGDYDAAVLHLTDVVTREPAHIAVNIKLSQIYAFQRRLPLAREHLQRVLQADPQNVQARNLLQEIGS